MYKASGFADQSVGQVASAGLDARAGGEQQADVGRLGVGVEAAVLVVVVAIVLRCIFIYLRKAEIFS